MILCDGNYGLDAYGMYQYLVHSRQGCQNKPAPGAFDRLLVHLRRLLCC